MPKKFSEIYLEVVGGYSGVEGEFVLTESMLDPLKRMFVSAGRPILDYILAGKDVVVDTATKQKIVAIRSSDTFVSGKATMADFKTLFSVLGQIRTEKAKNDITAMLKADKNFQATLAMAMRDPGGELRQVLVQLNEKPWWLTPVTVRSIET